MEIQTTIKIIVKEEEQKIISEFMETLEDNNGFSYSEIIDILEAIQLKEKETDNYGFTIEYL